MTLFNERIKDIDFEISELNQQIKKLELEQKNMKERNAEVDKALKILGKVVEDYRSDEEVIFDLKHALSAMFLTPEELDRIANSQGSEFHPDAIAEYERNSYQSEAVEVGASEVEPKPEPQPKPEPNSEETQSDEPEKKSEPESKMSASGSVILNEKPAVFWDNGKTLRMFLETKPDAITTFEKAQAEGITDYHEIHQCGGDYILVLGNIDTREKANKVL